MCFLRHSVHQPLQHSVCRYTVAAFERRDKQFDGAFAHLPVGFVYDLLEFAIEGSFRLRRRRIQLPLRVYGRFAPQVAQVPLDLLGLLQCRPLLLADVAVVDRVLLQSLVDELEQVHEENMGPAALLQPSLHHPQLLLDGECAQAQYNEPASETFALQPLGPAGYHHPMAVAMQAEDEFGHDAAQRSRLVHAVEDEDHRSLLRF